MYKRSKLVYCGLVTVVDKVPEIHKQTTCSTTVWQKTYSGTSQSGEWKQCEKWISAKTSVHA